MLNPLNKPQITIFTTLEIGSQDCTQTKKKQKKKQAFTLDQTLDANGFGWVETKKSANVWKLSNLGVDFEPERKTNTEVLSLLELSVLVLPARLIAVRSG